MSAAASTTPTRERPIIFSGDMIRAIIEGRKTQTRRIVAPQPVFGSQPLGHAWEWPYRVDGTGGSAVVTADPRTSVGMLEHGPFQIGDRMWVKETFRLNPPTGVYYRADADEIGRRWTPSIFLPRWASRIDLDVVAVRVERLHDITEDDAEAEGVAVPTDRGGETCARAAFARKWDEINGKRKCWDLNPWVWVVGFRRTRP